MVQGKLIAYVFALAIFVVGAVLCFVDKTLTPVDAFKVLFIGLAIVIIGYIWPPTTP